MRIPNQLETECRYCNRAVDRKRRRKITRMIKSITARLEAQYEDLEIIPPRQQYCTDAARELETAFGLRPGSALAYFFKVELRAEFYGALDWRPSRRDLVLWRLDLKGPQLP
jgi:hypothetical protein